MSKAGQECIQKLHISLIQGGFIAFFQQEHSDFGLTFSPLQHPRSFLSEQEDIWVRHCLVLRRGRAPERALGFPPQASFQLRFPFVETITLVVVKTQTEGE